MTGLSSVITSVTTALANQPAPVVLGSLTLAGAEAPSRITIGGRQLAAIHKLPGGGRVIDAMGPDDSAIVWQGVFLGPNAASRVRVVDALRSGGQSCTLSFGDYLFEVIVVEFKYSYESRGAVISYSIRAEKTQFATDDVETSTLQGVLSDCAAAAQFLTNTKASIAAYGGLTVGSGSVASIVESLTMTVSGAGASVSAADAAGTLGQSASALVPSITALQAAIPLVSTGALSGQGAPFSAASGSDLMSTVQIAGVLAGIVQAGGYINRASVSLASADATPASIGIHS